MKRADLMRHLQQYHCLVLRDEGKHTVVFNPINNRTSVVPRHREINEFTARGICRQLGIPRP